MNAKLLRGKPAYRAPIVGKTVQLVTKILTSHENPGISQLAAELSLAKSTTHGILASLEESGWILRDPLTRRYTCGHALHELIRGAEIRVPMIHSARPHLEQLGRELDEDVFLGMFTPNHILILDQIESTKKLRVITRPGTRLSIFAGAAGKIFLAHSDRDLVERLVRESELPRFTARSITDADEYLAELEKVRSEGIATDLEEYIVDVRAVAAPIFRSNKSRKRIVAGLWVVGRTSDFPPAKIKKTSELARRAGESISVAIRS